MHGRLFAVVLAALHLVFGAQHAHAQEAALGALHPRDVAALYLASQLATAQASAPDYTRLRELRSSVGRSRRITAFGAGLAAGGATGLLIGGRKRYCSYHEYHLDRTVPRVVGGAITTLGVGLLAYGVTRLVRTPRAERALVRMSPGGKIGLVGMAVGAAALGTAVVLLSTLDEEIGCWNT